MSTRIRHKRQPSTTLPTQEKKNETKKIKFKATKKLGFSLAENCVVKTVADQSAAFWAGIAKGWVIVSVAGSQTPNTGDCKVALKGAISNGKAFFIEFRVPKKQEKRTASTTAKKKKANTRNSDKRRTKQAEAKAVEDISEIKPKKEALNMGLQAIVDKENEEKEQTGVDNGLSLAQRILTKFDEIDKDGNGKIDLEEFTDCLKSLGLIWKDEDINEFIKSHGGSIDLKEFSAVCSSAVIANPAASRYPPPLDMNMILISALNNYRARKKMHSQFGTEIDAMRKDMGLDGYLGKQIIKKFKELDSNDDGTIDQKEFVYACELMGLQMKKGDIPGIMKRMGARKKGIEMADFSKIIALAAESNREATVDQLLGDSIKSYVRKGALGDQLKAQTTLNPTFISALQRAQMKFNVIDYKRDGQLDAEELTPYLKKLGFRWTKRQIKSFIDAVDLDSDGFIQEREFKTALYSALARNPAQTIDEALRNCINSLSLKADVQEELGKANGLKPTGGVPPRPKIEKDHFDVLAEAFLKADVDGSGALDAEEFTNLMLDLGLDYRREYIERIFRKIDVNGDRQLSFSELKNVMINALKQNADQTMGNAMVLVITNMLNTKELQKELLTEPVKLKSVVKEEKKEDS